MSSRKTLTGKTPPSAIPQRLLDSKPSSSSTDPESPTSSPSSANARTTRQEPPQDSFDQVHDLAQELGGIWLGDSDINYPKSDISSEEQGESEAEGGAGSAQQGKTSVGSGKLPRPNLGSEEEDSKSNVRVSTTDETEPTSIVIGGEDFKTLYCWSSKYWVDECPMIRNVRFEEGELDNVKRICRECLQTYHVFTINHRQHHWESWGDSTPDLDKECSNSECRKITEETRRRETRRLAREPAKPEDGAHALGKVQSYPIAKQGQIVMCWICKCSWAAHFPDDDMCVAKNCGRKREALGNYAILAPRQGSDAIIELVSDEVLAAYEESCRVRGIGKKTS